MFYSEASVFRYCGLPDLDTEITFMPSLRARWLMAVPVYPLPPMMHTVFWAKLLDIYDCISLLL